MRIALYGMPCAGKTTIMDRIPNAKIVHGGFELNRLCGGQFSALSDDEKNAVRVRYTEFVRNLDDELIVSDGHYSFLEDVAFTESDGELYDAYLYIYCQPETLLQRYRQSVKNSRFAENSVATIEQWQCYEIEHLRAECHKRNKDFYVVSDNEGTCTHVLEFIELVRKGYSGFRLAQQICRRIQSIYPSPCNLYIIDGDKTAIEQDSFRFCCDGKTHVFDGNFYTGYQSFLFNRELEQRADCHYSHIDEIRLNYLVWDEIRESNYVVLSSGIADLWETIGSRFGMKNIIADPAISADVKYFVVKLLQNSGYIVSAYGDSKIDLYMLRQADAGTLLIGKRLNRSLRAESLHGIRLIYDHSFFRLTDSMETEILDDIRICKSNSGIRGSSLALAHMRLGNKLGSTIADLLPSHDTAILVLERGGRFFGDGLYMSFGGVFYAFNPSKDPTPDIKADRIIVVDSVINTGKSILRLIQELRSKAPNVDIIIAANVIQEDAIKLLSDFKVFTVRTSSNSFVGKNQAKQTGKTGPDTADRLFNLIERRF